MQIKRRIIYTLLVIITIALSSCSVSRRAVSKYQTLSQRAQVTLEWGEKQYSMSGVVRVWRDELVVMSIQPMFGIEMVRVEATQDSVWIFDKMNRRYTSLAYNELAKVANTKINYKTIQEFASDPITDDKKSKMKMEFDYGKHHMQLLCKFSNREYNTLQPPAQTKTNKYKRVSLREILPI